MAEGAGRIHLQHEKGGKLLGEKFMRALLVLIGNGKDQVCDPFNGLVYFFIALAVTAVSVPAFEKRGNPAAHDPFPQEFISGFEQHDTGVFTQGPAKQGVQHGCPAGGNQAPVTRREVKHGPFFQFTKDIFPLCPVNFPAGHFCTPERSIQMFNMVISLNKGDVQEFSKLLSKSAFPCSLRACKYYSHCFFPADD